MTMKIEGEKIGAKKENRKNSTLLQPTVSDNTWQ